MAEAAATREQNRREDSWEPAEAEAPSFDESFESARPAAPASRVAADEGAGGDESSAAPEAQPSLEAMMARVPESNRRHVEELFHGHFTAVRRLDRKKLR